jgi:hypothetical protein
MRIKYASLMLFKISLGIKFAVSYNWKVRYVFGLSSLLMSLATRSKQVGPPPFPRCTSQYTSNSLNGIFNLNVGKPA